VKKSRPIKSLKYAQRRIRELEKLVSTWRGIAGELNEDRAMLAKLAADGPAFFNPLNVHEAKRLRNLILGQLGMNPDGTFIKKAAEQARASKNGGGL
jgi:hypothetical protein